MKICKTPLEVVDWMKAVLLASHFEYRESPFSTSPAWQFSEGRLIHREHAFFTVEGLKYRYSRDENYRFRPIINQPEIGILGFILSEIDGVAHILFQGKVEPGNVGSIQLGPSLQATQSNYLARHKGQVPAYTHLFLNPEPKQVLVDQLQSEQGTRFFKKLNRNIALWKPIDQIDQAFNTLWVPMSILPELLKIDNLINTDARSVIASILLFYSEHFFPEAVIASSFLKQLGSPPDDIGLNQIVSALTRTRAQTEIEQSLVSLACIPGLEIQNSRITASGSGFDIVHIDVYCEGREVSSWDQPIASSHGTGKIGLVLRKSKGQWLVLLQFRREPGIRSRVEISSSVHLTDVEERSVEFQDKLWEDMHENGRVVFDARFSEEGGRFLLDENNYVISILDKTFETPEEFIWAPASVLRYLILFTNTLSNEARGILACLLSVVTDNDNVIA